MATVPVNPTTSTTIHSPSTINETCTDSAVYRWEANAVKSCDWIGRNADRVDKLCPKEYVAFNCSQARRKYCGDVAKF